MKESDRAEVNFAQALLLLHLVFNAVMINKHVEAAVATVRIF